MRPLRVAIVSSAPEVREAAAAALAGAPRGWSVELAEDGSSADVVVSGPNDGLPGSIVLDPGDPTGLIERVSQHPGTGRARVYGVVGAGGGVGATTVALHLAAALGRGSAYLDLDVRWGSAARLDLDRGEIRCWAAGIEGDELRRAALPIRPGFRALFAPPGATHPDTSLLQAAAREFEHVVVDGAGPPGGLVGHATAYVLVLPSAAQGVRRAVEALEALGDAPVALVLNRTGAGGRLDRRTIARRLCRGIALELPHTPALRDAEDEGRLLTGPWCRFSRRIARLAGALVSA